MTSPRHRDRRPARRGQEKHHDLPNDLTQDHTPPLIYWPQKTLVLSTRQMDIISLLIGPEGSITKLNKYRELKQKEAALFIDNENYEGIEDETYEALFEEHLENIAEAIRVGLIWHPLISEFLYTHRTLGNKKILRKIKRGLETGVKRPIKMKDIKFILYLNKIIERRNEGETWKELRRDLMKRNIIEKMTWQGLEKKVKEVWRKR